jgi:hypothetical protein
MDIRERGYEEVDWSELVQDRAIFCEKLMNLQIPYKEENLLTSYVRI